MLGRTDALEKYLGAIQSQVLALTLYQGEDMSLVQYRELLEGALEMIREENNGELFVPFNLILDEFQTMYPTEYAAYDADRDNHDPRVQEPAKWKKAREAAEQIFVARLATRNLNNHKFGNFKDKLRDKHLLKESNAYPNSLDEVIFIASNLTTSQRGAQFHAVCHLEGPDDQFYDAHDTLDGVVFAEEVSFDEDTERHYSERHYSEAKVTEEENCLHCANQDGDPHPTKLCPFLSTGQQNEVSTILREPVKPPTVDESDANARLVLDTGSSDIVTAGKDANQLDNLRQADRALLIQTNAGVNRASTIGDLGTATSYIDPNAVQSVFPISALADANCRVQLDTDKSPDFVISKDGHSVVSVPQPEHHLPTIAFSDARNLLASDSNKGKELAQSVRGNLTAIDRDADAFAADFCQTADFEIAGVSYVQTVNASYDGFTQHEIKKAFLAREAAGMIGNPSEAEFQFLVSSDKLGKCPFDLHDVKNAYKIFGPNLATVRGKTVRRAPTRVTTDFIDVPRDFLLLIKDVTLVADVMFVNKLPFLITMSRKVKFITVEFLSSRSAKQLSKRLKRVLRVYGRAGFNVQAVLMDMEFDKVAESLEGEIVINTAAAREHIAEIEREIRHTKERCRCTISCLPYTILHKQIVIHLVYFAVLWLNAFPRKSGCSSEFAPRAIVCRSELSYEKHCRAAFGEYIEGHTDPDRTNGMESRTFPAIYLGPTGNRQGSVKAFDLETCRVHKIRNFTRMKMPQSIADEVDEIGRRTRREVYDNVVHFADRNKNRFAWDPDDDLNELMAHFNRRTQPSIPAEFPSVSAQHSVEVPSDDNATDDLGFHVDDDPATSAQAAAALDPSINIETSEPAAPSALSINESFTAGVNSGRTENSDDPVDDPYSKVTDDNDDDGDDLDNEIPGVDLRGIPGVGSQDGDGEDATEIAETTGVRESGERRTRPPEPKREHRDEDDWSTAPARRRRRQKKKSSADQEVMAGPQQEWETKALSSDQPLGRDERGRSMRRRQTAPERTGQNFAQTSAKSALSVKPPGWWDKRIEEKTGLKRLSFADEGPKRLITGPVTATWTIPARSPRIRPTATALPTRAKALNKLLKGSADLGTTGMPEMNEDDRDPTSWEW
ncbi:hypothetical protein THAOC_13102 [Thalassiosira oceanica]|uniref:Uncharacterized protein n=1 Tax=Thalassiosira oceanica TaxID=159749 RepID=K0SLZ5_THAOC|nr:hypothetical protein THAOC_13102 [Thalassiosira oceanica]|eukprot:EJK65994.1 hypothetical protein THAOC_13102 [Thalassiosira oceanica]